MVQKPDIDPFQCCLCRRTSQWLEFHGSDLPSFQHQGHPKSACDQPYLLIGLLLEPKQQGSMWCPVNPLFIPDTCNTVPKGGRDTSFGLLLGWKNAFGGGGKQPLPRRATFGAPKGLLLLGSTYSGALKPPRAGDVDQFQHILEQAAKTSLITFLNPELM